MISPIGLRPELHLGVISEKQDLPFRLQKPDKPAYHRQLLGILQVDIQFA
jgi:hypothetical protein